MLRSPNKPAPKRFVFELSMGLDHHVTMRLSSPVTAMLAAPTTASLTASHRVRVALCVQARRCVPLSSSRLINGAPQKAPTRAGTRTRTVPINSSSR
jgi:hypothetical protein